MYRENAAFISITLKLPLCKSEKLNAQHGVPHGQRSMFKKRKERKGKRKHIKKKRGKKKRERESLETYATFIIRENRTFYQFFVSILHFKIQLLREP